MQSRQPFERYLIYSQTAFYAMLIVCIAIAPASLRDNQGLSYFGVHLATVIPFGIGMLGSAYFLALAALNLPGGGRLARLRRPILALAILMAGIVITPFSVNNLFDWTHTAIGSILFSLQLVLSVWFTFWLRSDWPNWLFLAVEFGAGVVSLVYLAPPQGFLTQGQIVFQAAFSALIYRNLLASGR